MTPEQIARQIVLALGYQLPPASVAAVAVALRTYGDERAAEMRERAAQYLEQETDRPSDRSGELFWYVDKLLLDLAGAIRGLGMEKELGR